MDTRIALDRQASGLMLLLCMIWGLQQVVLKAAAADIAPLLQIALRSGVAALLVALLMFRRGERLALGDGNWRPGLLTGVLFALEFLLVGEALRRTSASHVVVFLYTAPIFVALALHWKLPAERLRAMQWLGIALAFAGLVAAFIWRRSGNGSGAGDSAWLGDLLALLAGVAWAATTVAIRLSSLAQASATRTLLFQLVAAFVLLGLAALGLGQTGIKPTALAWGSLLFQSLVVSFASYLGWFWLLRRYLASQLGVFSFLTPLFGMAFGVSLLGEAIEPGFLLGASLVLAGIALVSGDGWIRLTAGRFVGKFAAHGRRKAASPEAIKRTKAAAAATADSAPGRP